MHYAINDVIETLCEAIKVGVAPKFVLENKFEKEDFFHLIRAFYGREFSKLDANSLEALNDYCIQNELSFRFEQNHDSYIGIRGPGTRLNITVNGERVGTFLFGPYIPPFVDFVYNNF